MTVSATAPEILDQEFLAMRAKLLELAASLDRLDRGDGSVARDPRIGQIRDGIEMLAQDQPDRAEQIQLIFSRVYDDGWQDEFGITPR